MQLLIANEGTCNNNVSHQLQVILHCHCHWNYFFGAPFFGLEVAFFGLAATFVVFFGFVFWALVVATFFCFDAFFCVAVGFDVFGVVLGNAFAFTALEETFFSVVTFAFFGFMVFFVVVDDFLSCLGFLTLASAFCLGFSIFFALGAAFFTSPSRKLPDAPVPLAYLRELLSIPAFNAFFTCELTRFSSCPTVKFFIIYFKIA